MSSIFITSKKHYKSIAVGCFDGLHRGHFELFKHLEKDESALLVIGKKQKNAFTPFFLMKEISPFDLILSDFERLKNLSGSEFLALLKNEFKSLEKIVVGYDFAFGKDRNCKACDIESLSDFKAEIVPEFKLEGVSVHSKQIKDFLSKGNLKMANLLLGRDYELRGEQIKGQGLGSKELLPTLNLDDKGAFYLPQMGVYASFTSILKPLDEKLSLNEPFQNGFKKLLQSLENKRFKSVSFIGKRLSTDEKFSIETHILDENFKGFKIPKNAQIRIEFIDFLRENQKFENLSLLKTQITKDCENALKIL